MSRSRRRRRFKMDELGYWNRWACRDLAVCEVEVDTACRTYLTKPFCHSSLFSLWTIGESSPAELSPEERNNTYNYTVTIGNKRYTNTLATTRDNSACSHGRFISFHELAVAVVESRNISAHDPSCVRSVHVPRFPSRSIKILLSLQHGQCVARRKSFSSQFFDFHPPTLFRTWCCTQGSPPTRAFLFARAGL